MKLKLSFSYKCLVALLCVGSLFSCSDHSEPATLTIDDTTLMHEMRATPHPLDGSILSVNPPRFMWPDFEIHHGPALDGVETKSKKKEATYRIRIARDKDFTKSLITAERKWAFFNPYKVFESGKWYWQHAYVEENGTELWSPIYTFEVDASATIFNPPAFEDVASMMPKNHPRIVLDSDKWDQIIEQNLKNEDAIAYIERADMILKQPVAHLSQQIDTTHLAKLTNEVQYKSSLIRESRKIVDREENYIETLVKAYALTKERQYANHAMDRLKEMISWRENHLFAGDFNQSALLQTSTQAYDLFYHIISEEDKALLLRTIRTLASNAFSKYVNHLENHIADNHVVQMTLRIFTMAAFATLDEIPEARLWSDYCYNLWVSRFPGLNNDGAWHNGDSYFQVNMRTLVEVPAFYSRISGFDFFRDPWYEKNVDYIIYHQPAFSKSAGHGNAHENRTYPLGERIAYADVLARALQNPFAARYVRMIEDVDPQAIRNYREPKCGDVTWYRLTHDKSLPDSIAPLNSRSLTKVFPNTGLATMHTNLDAPSENAMLSFRSSPYGSTSHAHANQNAFNTFYGGKAVFYSSGHRTGFTDPHCMYSYRNTRAHNTILVDGMGQKIGTEGYGWIPRFYEGDRISYVVGDASNAYGEVVSRLWLERAKLSGVEYSPENGWDKNRLRKFRRHIIKLGKAGVSVVFDELEAFAPVSFDFMLHTRELPMEVHRTPEVVTVTGRNSDNGVSSAHIFASSELTVNQTDQFHTPAVNWLRKTDAAGNVLVYDNHYHFTASTPKVSEARILTVLDTHGKHEQPSQIRREGDVIWVNNWKIESQMDISKPLRLIITNEAQKVSFVYDMEKDGGATYITDQTKSGETKVTLVDQRPQTEI